MVGSNAVRVFLGGVFFVACGGEAVRKHEPATSVAGSGGTTTQSVSEGARNPGDNGPAQSASGSGGALHASAGATGHGGVNAGGSGGFVSGGEAGAASEAGAGDSTGGPSIGIPELLVPIVKAFCATARTCCSKAGDALLLGNCESAYGMKDQTAQLLARGTITIDPADLAKCQAAYEAAANSCDQVGVRAACTGILHGTVAEGGPCTVGAECAGAGPKLCLVPGGQDDVGVCKPVPGGKVGDECSITCVTNEGCAGNVLGVATSLTACLESDGLFCSYDTSPSECKALLALGANCENDDQCGHTAYCDIAGSSTCKKRGQLNDACGNCLSGLTCRDGTCQGRPFTADATCNGYSLGPE